MDDRTISLNATIDALDEQIRQCDKTLSAFDISMKDEYAVKVERASLVAFRETLEYMPSVESELENKIRAIGYTGKEGRIYIGGRLFAVRELPQ